MVSFLVYVLKVVSLTNEVSLNEIFSRYSVLSNNPIFFLVKIIFIIFNFTNYKWYLQVILLPIQDFDLLNCDYPQVTQCPNLLRPYVLLVTRIVAFIKISKLNYKIMPSRTAFHMNYYSAATLSEQSYFHRGAWQMSKASIQLFLNIDLRYTGGRINNKLQCICGPGQLFFISFKSS